MISNVYYLVQKYAEAREKMLDAANEAGDNYWRGSMDTYHNLLCTAFDGWAAPGTTGWYVFYEQLNYEEALNQVAKDLEN
jgi:hypothetical protein